MRFFKQFEAWGKLFMAGIFVIVVAVAAIQTVRASNLKQKNTEYLEKIESHERAVLLTEQLTKRNAELIEERDGLLEDLQNAEGYQAPLPGGIADIVNRVRRNPDRVE